MTSGYTYIRAGGRVVYRHLHVIATTVLSAMSPFTAEARTSNNTSIRLIFYNFCKFKNSIIRSVFYLHRLPRLFVKFSL